LVLFVHLRVSGSVWIAGLDTPGARSPGRVGGPTEAVARAGPQVTDPPGGSPERRPGRIPRAARAARPGCHRASAGAQWAGLWRGYYASARARTRHARPPPQELRSQPGYEMCKPSAVNKGSAAHSAIAVNERAPASMASRG
jgi:hypothetical protein